MGRLDSGRKGVKDNPTDLQFRNYTGWAWDDRMNAFERYSFIADSWKIGVVYLLYTEVFASDSKTRHFNRTVDRIRGDTRALDLLGSGKTIRAFGEPTASKWSRNRPLA